MANKLIPKKDVGKAFMDAGHDAMSKHFPQLTKGTPTYNRVMSQFMVDSLSGLFHSSFKTK